MKLAILGTVGVPGRYDRFETLAENLVRYADAHNALSDTLNSDYGRALKARFAGRPGLQLLDPVYQPGPLYRLRAGATSSACRLMSDSGFPNWDYCESWCLEGEHHAQVSSC